MLKGKEHMMAGYTGNCGGGGKVATLMQSPAAAGLFHRAIMMSGSGLQGSRPRVDREIALSMLRYLHMDSIRRHIHKRVSEILGRLIISSDRPPLRLRIFAQRIIAAILMFI